LGESGKRERKERKELEERLARERKAARRAAREAALEARLTGAFEARLSELRERDRELIALLRAELLARPSADDVRSIVSELLERFASGEEEPRAAAAAPPPPADPLEGARLCAALEEAFEERLRTSREQDLRHREALFARGARWIGLPLALALAITAAVGLKALSDVRSIASALESAARGATSPRESAALPPGDPERAGDAPLAAAPAAVAEPPADVEARAHAALVEGALERALRSAAAESSLAPLRELVAALGGGVAGLRDGTELGVRLELRAGSALELRDGTVLLGADPARPAELAVREGLGGAQLAARPLGPDGAPAGPWQPLQLLAAPEHIGFRVAPLAAE
jgi:hypothetical protein